MLNAMKPLGGEDAAMRDEFDREAARQSMRLAYAESARVEAEHEDVVAGVSYGLGEDGETPGVGLTMYADGGGFAFAWVYIGCGARMLRREVDAALERIKGGG